MLEIPILINVLIVSDIYCWILSKKLLAKVVFYELLTDVCGTTAKVFGWYDNEFGYFCRLKNFLMQ